MISPNDMQRYKRMQTQALRRDGGGSQAAPSIANGGGRGFTNTPIQMAQPQQDGGIVNQLQRGNNMVKTGMDTYKTGKNMYDMGQKAYGMLGGGADSGTSLLGTGGQPMWDWGSGGGMGGNAAYGQGAGMFPMDAAGSSGAGVAGAGTDAATAAGATDWAGAAGTAGEMFGQGMGYLKLALMAKDMHDTMGKEQGVEGRDKGSMGGAAMGAGQGAAAGASVGGLPGAIAGAALGNETYQMQHGNRKGSPISTASWTTGSDGFKDMAKYALKGGAMGADIGNWTGLW